MIPNNLKLNRFVDVRIPKIQNIRQLSAVLPSSGYSPDDCVPVLEARKSDLTADYYDHIDELSDE